MNEMNSHLSTSFCRYNCAHQTVFSFVLVATRVLILAQKPGICGSNMSTSIWTRLLNVAGTAPSCGLRGFIQTHIWGFGGCQAQRPISCGSRVNCMELCRRGSVLRRRRLAGAAHLPHTHVVYRTVYGYSNRARWWGSMSPSNTKFDRCALDKWAFTGR